MASIKQYNLSLLADDDFLVKFSWKTKSGKVLVSVDISAYTFTMEFKNSAGVVISADTEITKEDLDGRITVKIPVDSIDELLAADVASYRLKAASYGSNRLVSWGKVKVDG